MTSQMMDNLSRTECTLARHLEDLNDEIYQNNGRIKDHMTLDGINDCLCGLKTLRELMKSPVIESAEKTLASSAVAVK